ncbi:MAG: glycosyl hydrolase [Candidatus Omnitrophota bacterium]
MKDNYCINPFGVLEFLHWNHDWNNYEYPSNAQIEQAAVLMREAGAGFVRMDFLWDDIEPEAGKFIFDKYDDIVNILDRNNIGILGLLNYNTRWDSGCGKWNCPPSDNRLFVNYAVTVVSRYKNRIKYWEIWNEPDSCVYWARQDGLKGYCDLLRQVYIDIKKTDSECQVLNGGFANGLISVRQFYEQGIKDYFDILNIHLFISPFEQSAVERVAAYPELVYQIMAENADSDKKVWVTEIGCPGVRPEIKTKDWWLGKNPTEEQQAEWVRTVLKGLIKNNCVERIFWAFFRDTKNHWHDGTDYFGLLRGDFSKKPAFSVYKECVDNWRIK